MAWRVVLGASSLVVVGALAACQQQADDGAAAGGDVAAVTQDAFDKNNVLDDKSLRDSTAMSADAVQKFLLNTPWGGKSILASYTEGGKSAAQIMVDAATKHDVNPLEMLVRVQMAQGLVKKTSAPEATIAIAFGCGCPDSPVADAYRGFANQAECAAGTLGRSIDRALTASGTVSGWARNKEKTSEDGLAVTPANAATAAIYTYMPWVGEKGGGKAGVGGASLHWETWGSFAAFANYGDWATEGAQQDAGGGDPAPGSGATPDAGADDAGADDAAPAGSTMAPDAGAKPKDDGSDDNALLNCNNAIPAPAVNAPPPGSHPRTSKAPNLPQELPQASEAELAGKPKSTGGCATSRAPTRGVPALLALAALTLLVHARRRASRAS
jgi:hypothetical protein